MRERMSIRRSLIRSSRWVACSAASPRASEPRLEPIQFQLMHTQLQIELRAQHRVQFLRRRGAIRLGRIADFPRQIPRLPVRIPEALRSVNISGRAP